MFAGANILSQYLLWTDTVLQVGYLSPQDQAAGTAVGTESVRRTEWPCGKVGFKRLHLGNAPDTEGAVTATGPHKQHVGVTCR